LTAIIKLKICKKNVKVVRIVKIVECLVACLNAFLLVRAICPKLQVISETPDSKMSSNSKGEPIDMEINTVFDF
jgi:hypothetical protein